MIYNWRYCRYSTLYKKKKDMIMNKKKQKDHEQNELKRARYEQSKMKTAAINSVEINQFHCIVISI